MRKGQAAMEFLMTYGWAILVVLIAIGLLAYFIKPQSLLPEQCILNAPLSVEGGISGCKADTTGVTLMIRNGGDRKVTVNAISFKDSNGDIYSSCTQTFSADNQISTSGTQTFAIPCTGLTSGDNFKADIAVSYDPQGALGNQTTGGSIIKKVV